MLRVTIACTVVAVFAYLYEDVLFSTKSFFSKVRQIPGPLAFYAAVFLAALTVQDEPLIADPPRSTQAVTPQPMGLPTRRVEPTLEAKVEHADLPTVQQTVSLPLGEARSRSVELVASPGAEDPLSTGSISPAPLPFKPLNGREAAVACAEQAINEARMTGDMVAENWLSSMQDFTEAASGEVTARFAIGPRSTGARGKVLCPTEARLSCHIEGTAVSVTQPIHMTGRKFAC